MKRLTLPPIAAILISFAAPSSQQSENTPDSPEIATLQRDVAAGYTAAQDEFWQVVESKGTPLVENLPGNANEVLATFVWRDPGDTKSVILNARINGVDPLSDQRSQMKRVPGTTVWYVSHRFPADAEFLYQLVVNPFDASGASAAATMQRALRPDPLNLNPYPEKSDPLFDESQPWRNGSIARMPAVPDNPWLARRTNVPTGTFRNATVKSEFLTMANPRVVWVYISPGASLRNPNVLVLFDGGTTYQLRIPTTIILDNLYASHKIDQTVAVFVDNGAEARAFDMTFNDAFVKFLTDELLPWVQQEYKFKAERSRTVVGGDSLGGLVSAYAALRRPDVIGNVLSQSGSFQFNNRGDVNPNAPEWLVGQFATAAKSNVFFHLDVGLMEDRTEGNTGTTLLGANRHLADVLRAKGYGVHYVEVYADHDPVHWRRTLPDALMATLVH
jgi:enterochelin esterase-like enzyme